MAHWKPKTVKGRTYVFVYTYRDGRQVQVKPRSKYKHLDGHLADPATWHNIDSWVQDWALKNEKSKATPDHLLFSDDMLSRRLQEWAAYFEKHLGRDPKTVQKYESMLRRYAFPFFLERGLKDPGQWPGVSAKLFDFLREWDCSQALIAEVNNALRAFFRWLQEEGIVAWEGQLRLRNTRRESKRTPLSRRIDPDQVLRFAQGVPADSWHIRLLALAGYFCSLRPQETFALLPEDWAAGEDVRGFECSAAMREAGLHAELAVHVQRQRAARGKSKKPKAHSVGWVTCFSKEAADVLAHLVNGRPDGPLLAGDVRQTYREWARATAGTELDGIDLKDLRRASLYWLGHHSKLQPLQLMKHARHKEFETTQLYLRRPEEDAPPARRHLKLGA